MRSIYNLNYNRGVLEEKKTKICDRTRKSVLATREKEINSRSVGTHRGKSERSATES